MSGTCAITMAGFGSRFAAAGFAGPKYAIEALGLTLFEWSMAGLDGFVADGWRFMFAMRRGDRGGPALVRGLCAKRGIEVDGIVELDAPTDGQATTAMLLAERAHADRPFAVFNIDTFVRPGAMHPAQVPAGCDGWLPCFPGQGDAWSFARLDPAVPWPRCGRRSASHRTPPWACTGSGPPACIPSAIAPTTGWQAGKRRARRYVAPLYNQLVAEGRRVEIVSLEAGDVGMLGTPAQVAEFVRAPPAAAREIAGP